MSIFNIISQIDIEPDDLDIPTNVNADDTTVAVVLEVVFAALGAVAFIVIIIAGLQFVLSRGNAEKAAKARNTIIYAAVGIVIAVLAFSIVRFIVRSAT